MFPDVERSWKILPPHTPSILAPPNRTRNLKSRKQFKILKKKRNCKTRIHCLNFQWFLKKCFSNFSASICRNWENIFLIIFYQSGSNMDLFQSEMSHGEFFTFQGYLIFFRVNCSVKKWGGWLPKKFQREHFGTK